MTDEIKPALTPEEWRARRKADPPRGGVWAEPADGALWIAKEPSGYALVVSEALKHAVAALALDGEAFGFTRPMVDAIRRTAEHSEACALEARGVFREAHEEDARLARRAAAVIGALLPPEQER